jgi:hypothetical protein
MYFCLTSALICEESKECVLQEDGETRARLVAAFHVLQLRSYSQGAAHDARMATRVTKKLLEMNGIVDLLKVCEPLQFI